MLSTRSGIRRYVYLSLFILLSQVWGSRADAQDNNTASVPDDFSNLCAQQAGQHDNRRIVCADLAVLDQTIVYNRFGSFNPFGMMYALRRDLSPLVDESKTQTPLQYDDESDNINQSAPQLLTAAQCSEKTGAESGDEEGTLSAGNVRLKDCKRPRPITLRANAGDLLLVRVTNLLHQPKFPDVASAVQAPGFSEDFCHDGPTQDANRSSAYESISRGSKDQLDHGEVACLNLEDHADPADDETDTAANDLPDVDEGEVSPEAETPREVASDWPSTRDVNFVVQGLEPVADPVTGTVHGACLGLDAVAPAGSTSDDGSFLCAYKVDQEGVYFLGSHAAPAGGEGDGGSIVHGLFGAILIERQGSRWYRSQTSTAAFDAVWPRAEDDLPRHSRTGVLDYEKTDDKGIPYLNMARPVDGVAQEDFANATAVELVHSDLNAIIYCDATAPGEDCPPRQDPSQGEQSALNASAEPAFSAFREFSVFFHDELKTFYTRNFDDIPTLGQMSGVKDGFALNYGASGMGTILMANRKGIGPAADCMECLYEEFFLTSWANGDPALLERFADDPSNVHHSYLNDPVVFRNFHAGPKETHVFHLHAHQWFAGNDPNRGTYLDSQTVAPQQGFSYNIYHGGRSAIDGDSKGWWDTQGSGNRNRTLGDSIFHCHLYPHFAQGMWALWRVHDVLEDGTRLLPDGQPHAGLSIDFAEADGHKRLGSIDRTTGEWLAEQRGTPIPAIIPLPGEPVPLLPTYKEAAEDTATPMPGFPFYIAGQPGHRPPQAPLDIAQDLGPAPTGNADIDDRTAVQETTNGESDIRWLDGGIGRHLVKDGSKRELGIKVPDIDLLSLENDDQRREFATQLVAKSFALGDLSGHLSLANLELLDNVGTSLERGAMGFHFNGHLFDPYDDYADDTLLLKNVLGEAVVVEEDANAGGQYSTIRTPMPGVQGAAGNLTDSVDDGTADTDTDGSEVAKFAVNGGAPKPGAPFADPCAAPADMSGSIELKEGDPLFNGQGPLAKYYVDPKLLGFRRYEVSAVQLDLIVNQAGWHDPQTRINVLTTKSGNYKEATVTERISPVVSDNDEPFFFRAQSGECIEFRHTNELPKELELDDFQVKTPTDTVGQHIHLVKFDVTASDGSGNGWNYEDGTFAADELSARRCAATLGEVSGNGVWREPDADECKNGIPERKNIWRLPLSDNRDHFQTTVQRWFADPILSRDENDIDQDRTLRTVFTHDHFGPSSIQQHGFYSALVIEPGFDVNDEGEVQSKLEGICEADGSDCVAPLLNSQRLNSVAWGNDILTGTHKQILLDEEDPIHPNYREFALSIADFALLYDPRDKSTPDEFDHNILNQPVADVSGDYAAKSNQGMHRLVCEARWRLSPYWLGEACGNNPVKDDKDGSWFFEGDVPPSWVAGGRHRDDIHKSLGQGDLLAWTPTLSEVQNLRDHAVSYRQKAARVDGPVNFTDNAATLAKPVAPPVRPESISVDHHDPYLVNYRGAPIPLRIGDKLVAEESNKKQSSDCAPLRMARQGTPTQSNGGDEPDSDVVTALLAENEGDEFGDCSIARQVEGAAGDMANALVSSIAPTEQAELTEPTDFTGHGDPETPLLEAYQGERIVFRLIQGAQEVQHTFNIAGLAFKRNIDQAFASGSQPLGVSSQRAANPTLRQQCFDAARDGRPSAYHRWLDSSSADGERPMDDSDGYWQNYEKLLAECDNIEGFTYAQEIGISEHFEMQGSLRSDVSPSVEYLDPSLVDSDEIDASVALSDAAAEDTTSDYLYNLGSVDAVWNGGWGLLRIYPDANTPIPASDSHAPGEPISEAPGYCGNRWQRVN